MLRYIILYALSYVTFRAEVIPDFCYTCAHTALIDSSVHLDHHIARSVVF